MDFVGDAEIGRQGLAEFELESGLDVEGEEVNQLASGIDFGLTVITTKNTVEGYLQDILRLARHCRRQNRRALWSGKHFGRTKEDLGTIAQRSVLPLVLLKKT